MFYICSTMQYNTTHLLQTKWNVSFIVTSIYTLFIWFSVRLQCIYVVQWDILISLLFPAFDFELISVPLILSANLFAHFVLRILKNHKLIWRIICVKYKLNRQHNFIIIKFKSFCFISSNIRCVIYTTIYQLNLIFVNAMGNHNNYFRKEISFFGICKFFISAKSLKIALF